MFKTTLLGSVGIVLLCGSALAADLPSRRAPPVFAPPPPLPVFSWTGFYAGVNGGYAFGGSRVGSYNEYGAPFVGGEGGGLTGGASGVTISRDAPIPTGSVTDYSTPLYGSKLNGGFGGGQIGYNYQFSQIVVGIEADGEGAGITASSNVSAAYFAPITGTFGTRNSIGVYGSARGRIGFAFDRFLVYATGGYAYADIHSSQSATYTDGYNSYASNRGLRSGYAVGGGVEYAFTNNVTVKGEYQYYDFGSRTLTAQEYVGGLPTGFYSYDRFRTNFNTVRVGLNYKFDTFVPAPVVARY